VNARRRGVALLSAAAALALAGCHVDDQAFEETIFSCNTTNPACGKTSEGRDMTCFQASQLDGVNFCAPACDMAKTLAASADGPTVCVHGNAELRVCDPTVGKSCGDTLGCLRTNVAAPAEEGAPDEGVCMTMAPCTVDDDCKDAVHSTCATTFLNDLYKDNHDLHSDHLYCLQRGCKSGGSSCSPGQACLPDLVDAAAHPPDICVPNCGSDDSCPPNHFCFQRLSGNGSPRICLPGLLGFLCESDIDCMVGTCMSDGRTDELELKLCTVPCGNDNDCAKWDGEQGKFVCSADGRCTTPDAYRGARCYSDDDCTRDEGTSCVFAGKPTKSTDQGTCSLVCGDGTSPDAACAPRGGFGHVCLGFTVDRDGNPKHGCYPGYFGPYYTCTSDADCIVDELKCRDTGGGRRLCTVACQNDDDCNDNRWTRGQSFCAGGACVPLRNGGETCQQGTQCTSKVCKATGTCQ
jgi:hypothetical protein